ncbi:MAG: DNA replication/repair protein RecF [Candidatus Margulisiibacteriota bacterium]
MFLKSIQLFNFRNYRQQQITFTSKISVILGDNAQGKTSLLEAVYLLAAARSPLEKNNDSLICFGQDKGKISAEIFNDQKDLTIEMEFQDNQKKIMVSKNQLSKASDLLGFFHAVYLNPLDTELVRGEPGDRRRFLDLIYAQADRKYTQALQLYQKTLKNRNALLKQENIDAKYLEILDEQLAANGVLLINRRSELIKKLGGYFVDIVREIIPGETALQYLPGAPAETSAYLHKLKARLEFDKMNGQTSTGPHRDDFVVLVSGNEARRFASNGQQRALSIGLKMAEVAFLREATARNPVILLDDVLLEMDEQNIQKILANIFACDQVLITTTSLARLPEAVTREAEVIRISAGAVVNN